MTKIPALLLALTLAGAPFQAVAAEGEVRTCALNQVIECTPDDGCGEWSIQEMALPRFVRIDLKGKNITPLDKEVTRVSKIDSFERREGLLFLHGNELRSWSMAVDEESGDFTLSAAGENEGFIVFGSCITP